MNASQKKFRVSVIVPVYNALDELKLCVESLRRHVDFDVDQVVIVDDCSPEPAVKEYLCELESPGFRIIFNEKNLGFSGTVNKGMSATDSDVILLNSDTVVTSGWIDKIVKCAYSDENIATVTPFSNFASHCSIPLAWRNNKIPNGFSIDQYSEIVERCSLKKYPEIHSAIGFCMFIKRTVLNDIGMFDAETFKKGYWEEDDFCARAIECGYINVLCDDTFIYHKGTASFQTEETRRLLQAHEKIVRERYPDVVKRRDRAHAFDKNADLRSTIELFSKALPGQKNILYVLHNGLTGAGGTEFCVQNLTGEMRKDFNIFVFYPAGGGVNKLALYAQEKEFEVSFNAEPPSLFNAFHNRELTNIFRAILSSFRIDLVHVLHTLNLSLDIIYEAQKQNIPVIASLHDFYAVCPDYNLLYLGENFCDLQPDLDLCANCLWFQKRIARNIPNFLQRWQKEFLRALSLCNEITTPSGSTREIILRAYPSLKINVVENGRDPFLEVPQGNFEIDERVKSAFDSIPDEKNNFITGWIYLSGTNSQENNIILEVSNASGFKKRVVLQAIPRPDVARSDSRYVHSGFNLPLPMDLFPQGLLTINIFIEHDGELFSNGKNITLINKHEPRKNSLNVAFLGHVTKHKGFDIISSLVREVSSDYIWHVFGWIHDENFSKFRRADFYPIGKYKSEYLASLFDFYQIDLVCILSIWPETYAYTLTEALLGGVPVIVTDIGALGERVRKLNCGWLVPVENSVNEIKNLLQRLDRDSEEFKAKKAIVQSLKIRTVSDMANDFREKYISLIEKQTPNYSPISSDDIKLISSSYIRERHGNNIQDLNWAREQLNQIYSSVGFKVLLRLKKIPSPIKNVLKKIILFANKIRKKIKGL